MYNDQLDQMTLPINVLFLDPNNPRFWSEQSQKMAEVPDAKIPDPGHQERALTRIANSHGLDELKASVLRNGFLPLDRIVVRELDGAPGKYVTIEGNRRLAAVKTLRDQIEQGTVSETGITEEYLNDLRSRTDNLEVLVYKGAEKDVAWILQGIRHIGGIRDWMPAQQGKLVADQIDKEGLTLSEAGQRFGLSAQAVGRRYRSYKALQQMREDEEFQSKAENKYYSLFEEAIRDKHVKAWLEWNDEAKRFQNIDNLKQFYAWICPDEEREGQERRVHDPRHIASLGKLLEAKQVALLDKVENHEISLSAAAQKLTDDDYRHDWKSAFKKIEGLLGDIPNSAIDNDSAEIQTALDELEQQIANLRKKAKSVEENSNKI